MAYYSTLCINFFLKITTNNKGYGFYWTTWYSNTITKMNI